MKKANKVVSFILSAILLCGLCAVFAGCSYDETIKNLQQQVEELQTQQNAQQSTIEQQQATIAKQQTAIDELSEGKDNLRSAVDELKKENEQLSNRVDELEIQIYGGTFYDLATAYNKGFLTYDDLQTIANYHNNGIVFDEELPDSVEKSIKEKTAFDLRHNGKRPISEANAQGIQIKKYYGEYNGCYAVILRNQYIFYPAVSRDEWQEIDGVKIYYGTWPDIVIWRTK